MDSPASPTPNDERSAGQGRTADPFWDLARVARLQADRTDRWHREPIVDQGTDWDGLVMAQHAFNFQLWHEEDKARSPDATDQQLADVKRSIDRFNQQRNDAIEAIDDAIDAELDRARVAPAADAPVNTETLGSAIDRLSIMSLRQYHFQEQIERADQEGRETGELRRRITLVQFQLQSLTQSAQQLADDLRSGAKRHQTFRQLKMYNDPQLNPAIYLAVKRVSGDR